MTLLLSEGKCMEFFTLLLAVSVFGVVTASAQKSSSQKESCCGATEDFAALGNGKEFRTAHMEPVSSGLGDIDGAQIQIDVPDGKPTVFWKFAATTKPTSTILVIHEWWGLNEHVLRSAQQLHTDLGGKVDVIAVDLYDGFVATNREDAAKAMQGADESRIRSVLGEIIRSVKTEKIGTIDWCFGGGWSLQASLIAGDRPQA
jgi:carboxymethylenebutenolidase